MKRQGSPGATGPTIFEIVVRGELRGLAPQLGSAERFLPLLVSGLAELPTPVVLVLDDLTPPG
jgi:hypothetical protein